MANAVELGFTTRALGSGIVAYDARASCSPQWICCRSIGAGEGPIGGLRNVCDRRLKLTKNRLLICKAGLDGIAPMTAAAYGFTLVSGGLVSYAKTGSKGSLIGGLTGGISLGLAYILMLNPDTKDIANAIGFGAAFLFIAVFGTRLAATRKPLPAGLLLAISIVASVVFVNAYFDARL